MGGASPDSYARIARYYDHVTFHEERPDAAFFVGAAEESGGPVLELGCGTGRVVIPTARAGVEIVGLDSSGAMLEICRRRLLEEPPEVRSRVTLVEGDMKDFDLGRRFRLVTTPFRPFQHLLTVDDQRACLAAVRRHLSRNGRFILDVFNPWLKALTDDSVGKEIDEDARFTTPDGDWVARSHRVVSRDPFRQVNHIELIYSVTHPDGSEERLVQAFPMRYLFRYEAEHLLVRCGFRIDALYTDYDRSAFGTKDPGELIFVASLGDAGDDGEEEPA